MAASEAERARIKEQKKAESPSGSGKHAEDVARRKATDIIFLGRGVSRGLADRRANVERLQAAGLPVLATPADVAAALGVTIPPFALAGLSQRCGRAHALCPLHGRQKIRRRARIGRPASRLGEGQTLDLSEHSASGEDARCGPRIRARPIDQNERGRRTSAGIRWSTPT